MDHKKFYNIILEKYSFLFDKYGFEMVQDEIKYNGVIRNITLSNNICEIFFYYERGGFEIRVKNKSDISSYYINRLIDFLNKENEDVIPYNKIIAKYNKEDFESLFVAYSELLQLAIEPILFMFSDENYRSYSEKIDDYIYKEMEEFLKKDEEERIRREEEFLK